MYIVQRYLYIHSVFIRTIYECPRMQKYNLDQNSEVMLSNVRIIGGSDIFINKTKIIFVL